MTDLPPRRELPPHLRNRMLGDLRAKLETPRKRSKTPYAVAAGVSALAAGAMLITAPWHNDQNPPASPKITGDKGVEVPAQRCAAAAAKVGGFPSNAHWRVLVHIAIAGKTTLAIKVDDNPVFCDTTATSVTLTGYKATPAYVPGSKTGTLLAIGKNTFGIVVDPSWGGLDAYESTMLDSDEPDLPVYRRAENMVLWSPQIPTTPLTVAPHDRKPAKPLPLPETPATTIVDRPYTGPPVDRTSDRGKFLAKCINLNAHTQPLVDPDTWQPGAWVTGPGDSLLVIRGIDVATVSHGSPTTVPPGIGGCWFEWWRRSGDAVPLTTSSRPIMSRMAASVATGKGIDGVIFGTVTDKAAKMTFTTDDGATATADVYNGTFAADLRAEPLVGKTVESVKSVTVLDAQGHVLYRGMPATN